MQVGLKEVLQHLRQEVLAREGEASRGATRVDLGAASSGPGSSGKVRHGRKVTWGWLLTERLKIARGVEDPAALCCAFKELAPLAKAMQKEMAAERNAVRVAAAPGAGGSTGGTVVAGGPAQVRMLLVPGRHRYVNHFRPTPCVGCRPVACHA